jgi:hypothetical protein
MRPWHVSNFETVIVSVKKKNQTVINFILERVGYVLKFQQ